MDIEDFNNKELIEEFRKVATEMSNRCLDLEFNSKFISKDRVILNTPHFACQIIENKEGVILDIFHRDGDLIDSYTYWNDDVIDNK